MNECLTQGFLTNSSWGVRSVQGVSFRHGDRYQIWGKNPLVSKTLKSLSVGFKYYGAQFALVSKLALSLNP